jgi:hypothetical protein
MRENHACPPFGPLVQLVCSGCGRIVGELEADARGGPVRINGADTRGGVRYVRPERSRHRHCPAPDDRVRFYCDDRCGIRYAVPRGALDALVRRIGRDPGPHEVRLPVRGPRNGRAPRLERRSASR